MNNEERRIPTASDVKRIALETIEGIRNKTMKVDGANAIAKLCNNIISTVSLEMEALKMLGDTGDKESVKNFLRLTQYVKEIPMSQEEADRKALQNKEPSSY